MELYKDFKASDGPEVGHHSRWREVRPLTTEERASFVVLSLYMVTFCIISFVYLDSLFLKILGCTSAVAGSFLFVAAFFNTEAPEKSTSIHPLRSYLISFFFVLLTLFLLRFIGGMISNFTASVIFTYLGLVAALVVFRKHMVQVISALAAILFLFVTFLNLDEVLAGRMGFRDVTRQCGKAIFRVGPIQDVTNLIMAGPYITYLNRIDYRNEMLSNFAAKKVAWTNDDELRKTKVLLSFVSNDINYVSDPGDGNEYVRYPVDTLIAGAGDCEDQALLLCSLLEAIGVRTYLAVTDDHVFALVRFSKSYTELSRVAPHAFIDGEPCYALDPSDPGAEIGNASAQSAMITRILDVRKRTPVAFEYAESK